MTKNTDRQYCLAEDDELFNLITRLNEILEEENRHNGIESCGYCKKESEMGRAVINSTHAILDRIRIDSFTAAEQMKFLRKTHNSNKCVTNYAS